MVFLRFILCLALLSSCAKTQYLFEQGHGQLSLLTRAKENNVVLKDVRIPSFQKEQIQKIQNYKFFFYSYFNKKPQEIYSKTTILEGEAVTYLLIASPFNEIKAKEECFPFMGCFPYLGFFKKSSAEAMAQDLKAENWITWIRPVYAYSTLGHFSDPILSSFFYYNDYELAELIFHELFHTVFWVKNEVDLNENLAMYFSERLALEYFKLNDEKKTEVLKKKKNNDLLMSFIVEKITELNQLYKNQKIADKENFQRLLDDYLAKSFIPLVAKKCDDLQIEKERCWPLKREWNNASFAALLTYEAHGDALANYHQSLKLDLKQFLQHLEGRYEKFLESDQEHFLEFVLKQ